MLQFARVGPLTSQLTMPERARYRSRSPLTTHPVPLVTGRHWSAPHRHLNFLHFIFDALRKEIKRQKKIFSRSVIVQFWRPASVWYNTTVAE